MTASSESTTDTAVSSAYRPNRWMQTAIRLAHAAPVGTVRLVLPNGEVRDFHGTEPGPDAVIVVHSDELAARFLKGGALGWCEAYLDGLWSSPDMTAVFEWALMNLRALRESWHGTWWSRLANAVMHLLRPNSRSGARRNISYHYDLGNNFYEKWLDSSMTYSSALFADTDDLVQAQENKYRAVAERMGLQAGRHVLEIGCGWGGFAEFAARAVGAKVTAITISREQHDYASARIQKAGLADKVEIRLVDYRDVTGQFDHIASIEMFEAVGEKYWPAYFGTLRERLVVGGRALLQIITIHDEEFSHYRRKPDYIQKYIFPGGMLPSIQALQTQVRKAGLTWDQCIGFGQDYAETLKRWNVKFQAHWPEIAPLGFDLRFKRMWEQYLCYCEAGFRQGNTDVVHLALSRP
jgi:cyclopropane-fatty-acyl-phospholipid synthase